MPANKIPERQDEPAQIKVLAARQQTYAVATKLLLAQLLLNIGLPVVGAAVALTVPEVRPHVAAIALAAIIFDALLIDRHQRVLLKRAAKIGEEYDCVVLELPWDHFTVGDKVEAEDIHRGATAYTKRRTVEELRSWYPTEAGEVPLHLGRIICQRANLRYDSELRRSFGSCLLYSSLGVILAFVTIALWRDSTLTAWVITMAPVTPFLSWAAREYYRQSDAADTLDVLRKEARSLWDKCLNNDCDIDECTTRSRELQSAIFLRRVITPLILPFVYRFRRSGLEAEMKDGAATLVAEYKRTKRSGKRQ